MSDLPSNFLLEPMPHDEAVKWIADKPVASRQVFDELLPELKARAFLITGVEDANVVAEIRQLVAELPAGAEWEVQRKAIIAKLGPWFGEGAEGKIAAEARATLLLRVHGFQAYRTYSRAVMDRQKDVFPWRQYLTVGDEKVRQSHAAMNDIIAPADSPFWNDKPGGWGCRCRDVALSDDEANEARQEDAGKALEDRRVLEGSRLKRAEDGFLMRALRDEKGKLVRPALTPWPVANPDLIAAPQSLRIDPAQIKARYDAVTWGEFRAAAEKNQLGDGRTVWQWLNEKKPAKVPAAPRAAKAAPKIALPPKPQLSPAQVDLDKLRKADVTGQVRAQIESANYKSDKDLSLGVNSTRIVRNGVTVVHKSQSGEATDQLRTGVKPGTQWKREIAASIIAEKLAIDLVPPTGAVTWKGEIGSAQLFQQGYKTAGHARKANPPLDLTMGWPTKLPQQLREDWQLIDDLLINTDRHLGNYMVKQDTQGNAVAVALIDNGLSLPVATGVVAKRFPGPAEGEPIGQLNQERLRQFVAEEQAISMELANHLEPEAIAGVMARAKTLLKRGTYGNFSRRRLNAQLPPAMQAAATLNFW